MTTMNESKTLLRELLNESDESLKITYMKPGPVKKLKSGKEKQGKAKETTEVVFFKDTKAMLDALNALKTTPGAVEHVFETNSMWEPQPEIVEKLGLELKDIEEINKRIAMMSSEHRRQGNVAQAMALSALNSNPESVIGAIKNLPSKGGFQHPNFSTREYKVPSALRQLAHLAVAGTQGAIGKGEFVAILMFGDESGANEPDLIVPETLSHWSIKASESASQDWYPSSTDEVNRFGMEYGPKLHAALLAILESESIQPGRDKDGIEKEIIEQIEPATKMSSYTLQNIKNIKQKLQQLIEDPRINITPTEVVNRLYTAIQVATKTEEGWDKGKVDVSAHNILLFRKNTLYAINRKDSALNLRRIQVNKPPKVGVGDLDAPSKEKIDETLGLMRELFPIKAS